MGMVANRSCGRVSVVGDMLVSSEVGESDSMVSPVVMGCVPVSAMTRTRSGAPRVSYYSCGVVLRFYGNKGNGYQYNLVRKIKLCRHALPRTRPSRRKRVHYLIYIIVILQRGKLIYNGRRNCKIEIGRCALQLCERRALAFALCIDSDYLHDVTVRCHDTKILPVVLTRTKYVQL